jgi:hypothetical protein
MTRQLRQLLIAEQFDQESKEHAGTRSLFDDWHGRFTRLVGAFYRQVPQDDLLGPMSRHRQLDVIPALPPTQKIGPAKSLFREILRVSHSLPICCGGDWDISKAKRHPFIICQSASQKILKGKWSSGVVSCTDLAQTKTNDV